MPLLPVLCDSNQNLAALAKWTAGHGGSFILGGGLTLADQQKEFFLRYLQKICPELMPVYEQRYPVGSYAQAQGWRETGLSLREYCRQAGIPDRLPRPIIAGEKRSLNKRIVEHLANQVYSMELESAPGQKIWAYRKAAWAIEDLEQDIRLIYRQMGRKGLESINDVGPGLAGVIEGLVQAYS
jgi:Helix-hairpin-helix domain